MTTETYTIIIPAGGVGMRLQEFLGGQNKQFVKLSGDKSILEVIIHKFFDYIPIKEFIIALPSDNFENNRDYLLDRFPTLKIVKGGNERQDSVYECIKAVKTISHDDKVIIHDSVRPFFTKAELLDTISKINNDCKGAVLASRAKDTIRIGDTEKSEVIDRNKVWLVQTPQVFNLAILKECYDKAMYENFYGTDDAMLLEKYNYPVAIAEGSSQNFKITDQNDLAFAKYLLQQITK